MPDSRLPSDPVAGDERPLPEVRLELTQAGVRQVLSLYAEEQAGRSAHGGAQIGFGDILRAIVARRWLVAASLVVGGLAGTLVLLVTPPLYTVTAQVVLDRQDSVDSALNEGRGGAAFIATQAEIMQSRVVISDAVTRLGAAAARAEPDPVAAALESLQASPVSGTQVVALSYLGRDPVYAASLLSATLEAYRDRLKGDEQRNQAQRLKAKESEYTVLIEEARRLEEQLFELRRSHFAGASGIDAVTAQNQIVRNRIEQLQDVQQRSITLDSEILAGGVESTIRDPATRSLQDRLLQAEAELERVTQTLKPDHPARGAAEREVSLLRRQVTDTAQATPKLLAREIEALKGVEAKLTGILAEERGRLAEAERMRRDEQLLLDEFELTGTLIEGRRRELLDQRLMARLADIGEIGVTARLIAEPVQPIIPTWPNPVLLVTVGVLLGLLVGTSWAVMSTPRSRSNWLIAEATGHPGAFRS